MMTSFPNACPTWYAVLISEWVIPPATKMINLCLVPSRAEGAPEGAARCQLGRWERSEPAAGGGAEAAEAEEVEREKDEDGPAASGGALRR